VVFFRYELLRPWWCSAWAGSSEWPARALIQAALARSECADRCARRSEQLALDVETKTKDKRVRQDVKIPVSVEYHVIADKVYEAF